MENTEHPEARIGRAVTIGFVATGFVILGLVTIGAIGRSIKYCFTSKTTSPTITTKQQIQIQSGWTCTIKGNYSYIRGRTKNIGNNTVNSFEIVALYKDAKGVVLDIDSCWLSKPVRPGECKEFEIIHKINNDYENVSLYVQNVRINW